MKMKPPLGIDFGTTKTLACRLDDQTQTPAEIRLGRLGPMPTSIHLEAGGCFLFGDDAEDNRVFAPSGYVPRVKRYLAWKTPVVLHGRAIPSVDLVSEFLRHVRNKVEDEAFNGPVGHTVITVPALLGPAAKQDLFQAAAAAGFVSVEILEEPVAGGLSFLRDNAATVEGTHFLVFDWGGGTLDFAVIHRRGSQIECVPELIGGDKQLGGEDIDDSIAEEVSGILRQRGRSQLDQQPEEYRVKALRTLVMGKELLSRKMTHTFRFELCEGPLEFTWSRSEFETFISQSVEKAVSHTQRFLEKVRAASVHLNGVILIGGSSQFPMVERRLAEVTGLRILKYDRSKEAVARGALLKADLKNAASQTLKISRPPKVLEKYRREEIGHMQSQENSPNLKERDARTAAFILERKTRYEDLSYFMREAMLCSWRECNVTSASAEVFSQVLSTVRENDERPRVALKVRQGLESVKITDFESLVTEAATRFVDSAEVLIKRGASTLIKIYPEMERYSSEFAIGENRKNFLVSEIIRDLKKLEYDYSFLATNYNQIRESFSRYDGIMSQNNWWLTIAGGAIGFLTGGAGGVAGALLGGWKGMDNKKFAENYSAAIREFLLRCQNFNRNAEHLLSQHIETFLSFRINLFGRLVEIYSSLAATGEQMEMIHRNVIEFERQEDIWKHPQSHSKLALIVKNLKHDSRVPRKSLDSIIEQLRENGLFLTPDGELDEEALAVLPPDAKTQRSLNDSKDILRTIRRLAPESERFFISPKIPEDKLFNAVKEYGFGCAEDEVLCLYDNSFWGGGGDGFFLTWSGIHWTGGHHAPWAEIKQINSPDDSDHLEINGESISFSMEIQRLPEFKKLLEKLRSRINSLSEDK